MNKNNKLINFQVSPIITTGNLILNSRNDLRNLKLWPSPVHSPTSLSLLYRVHNGGEVVVEVQCPLIEVACCNHNLSAHSVRVKSFKDLQTGNCY